MLLRFIHFINLFILVKSGLTGLTGYDVQLKGVQNDFNRCSGKHFRSPEIKF